MAENNNWLSENGLAQIGFYLNSSDVILVERYRTIKLLLDIFGLQFDHGRKLRLLDIGCGNGIITKKIREKFPRHEFHLLDGSGVMLEEARKALGGQGCTFIQSSFEDFVQKESDDQQYDFIYSSMAIHHLDFNGKSGLYAKIFRLLKFGGLFLNIDVVLPSSERSEMWQFQMWRDWMNETLSRNNMQSEIGKHDNMPGIYKLKPENKPSDLCDQLDLLRKTGFRDVDCYYKYGIFALFGGTK